MAESIEKRNADIICMSQDGVSHADIARKWRLSRTSIDVIVRNADKRRELEVKSTRLLEELRAADDLDRLWPTPDLIDLLAPLAVMKTALLRHWEDTPEISLRNLMDLTISEMKDPRPGYLITPLLGVRWAGQMGFWSVVKRLTEMDLGRRCNAEWGRRLARLSHASRIKGANRYSWSKPTDPVGFPNSNTERSM